MLRTISPTESASNAREALAKAMRALAEAQLAVLQAQQTVEMFEHNFRLGHYMQKPIPPMTFTVPDMETLSAEPEPKP
jgi:hypothetical protein